MEQQPTLQKRLLGVAYQVQVIDRILELAEQHPDFFNTGENDWDYGHNRTSPSDSDDSSSDSDKLVDVIQNDPLALELLRFGSHGDSQRSGYEVEYQGLEVLRLDIRDGSNPDGFEVSGSTRAQTSEVIYVPGEWTTILSNLEGQLTNYHRASLEGKGD
jgi:hypothetical protein